MAEGWYVAREGTSRGPVGWPELQSSARDGSLRPDDLILSPGATEWVSAGALTGLFAPPAASQGAPTPTPAAASVAAAEQPEPSRRVRWPWVASAGVLAIVLICACSAATVAWYRSRPANEPAPKEEGALRYEPPDPAAVISTEEWGPVPANRVGILLSENGTRKNAQAVAQRLDGTLAGEIEFAGIYVVETSGASEEDLRAALEEASSAWGVEAAFPDVQMYPDAPIAGVRCTALGEPAYAEGRGRPQEMTGVQRAWDILKAAGIERGPVHLGVADDGLYKTDEFKDSVRWETDAPEDELARPNSVNGSPDPSYSHGTMVCGIIAANDADKGIAGIAAPLRGGLTVSVTNVYGRRYGASTTSTPDPDDITKVKLRRGTYSVGALVALKKLADGGATIINCSWGRRNDSEFVSAAFRRFFTRMAATHPEVLFVCSAGNEGIAPDGTRSRPGGFALPNMITVGNLGNDGKRISSSNKRSRTYEVTLAAPGQHIVQAIDPAGRPVLGDGGTSAAAPQVTAAAALLRSIDPDLDAAALKRILTETARTSVAASGGGGSTPVPASVGGRCLAIDRAVLRVINDLRVKQRKSPLIEEDIAGSNTIDLTAERSGSGWGITASLPKVAKRGTDVKLTTTGAGTVTGSAQRRVTSPQPPLTWTVRPTAKAMTVHVERADTGACWRVDLQSYAGKYVGTFEDVIITPTGRHPYSAPVTVVIRDNGNFYGSLTWAGTVEGVAVATTADFEGVCRDDGNMWGEGETNMHLAAQGQSLDDPGTIEFEGYTDGQTISATLTGRNGSADVLLTRE